MGEYKGKYIYEGAAAYAEASSLQVDRAVRFRPERKYRDTKSGIITRRNPASVTIGTKRNSYDYYNDSFSTSYRPGAIAKPLGDTKIFPEMVISMVEVGEETGKLPEMLTKIADTYDEEVDNAVSALTSLIEPLMIVLLAGVVGTIVIALFMPLTTIITKLAV